MTHKIEFTVSGPEEMIALGRKLGSLARGGEIIYLTGELGAGKTTFVKGLALGLDITETITSASFILLQTYYGRLVLHHIDLYRLSGPAQLAALPLEDIGGAGEVVAIEWADLFYRFLEPKHLGVNIIYEGESRRVTLSSRYDEYKDLIERMKQC